MFVTRLVSGYVLVRTQISGAANQPLHERVPKISRQGIYTSPGKLICVQCGN